MKNNKYGLTVYSIQKYGFKKAVEIWEKYDRKCSVCKSVNRLSVHHIDISGQTDNPNHNLDNLQLLCSHCHAELHLKIRWEKQLEKQGGYLYKGRVNEYQKEKRQNDNGKHKKYMREYVLKNRDKINEHRREYNRKKKLLA